MFCGGASSFLGVRVRRQRDSLHSSFLGPVTPFAGNTSFFRGGGSISFASPLPHCRFQVSNSNGGGTKAVRTAKRKNRKSWGTSGPGPVKKTQNLKISPASSSAPSHSTEVELERQGRRKPALTRNNTNTPTNVAALYQNGDPLGRRDLGKCVVTWISQGMKAMALDFATAEVQGDGEFSELRQQMGPGLTFVIQAHPYLNAVPMPLGLEAVCLKACTHYPTLFDHFQRELRDVLKDFQSKSLVQDWRETESWKLLKELASSGVSSLLAVHCVLMVLWLAFET